MMEVKLRTSIDTFILIFIIGVVTLCVRGQVLCRATFDCAGGPGDDLGVAADGAGCCLGNPNVLAYNPPGSEDCIACVVVGFINASFSGPEQGPSHSVPVGYLKGGTVAGQNLLFNVRDTPGTAKNGSQFDYRVNTLRTTAIADGQISNVVVIFRVDSIAQEPNETFTLTLDPLVALNPREGLFFQNSIQVTIMDRDNVEFAFTEDDFRANEPDSSNPATFLPVLVSKSTRIASRVELVVVPLTVQEAIDTSLPLPPNIPQNDPRSPPFANLADFNNTNITLVFEPDEDGEVNEMSTPISVTDDAINEATEQVFVAELILVSSLDSATVNLTTRPSTLCRIIDNDPIRIGFELPGYTYTEPQFDEFIDEFYVSPTGRPENGPIFLLKEDNVISEQTFLVSFEATDSVPSGTQSAAIDLDYRFAGEGQTSQIEFFFPIQQRIPFPFELHADTLPEGTEAFQASVSPEDTRELGGGIVEQFPTSLSPLTLSSEIFITILDNDPIVIGFTNTSYTVDEGIGILQIDLQIFIPPNDQPLQASVDLVIQSVSGSATGGSDYQEIIALNHDVFLIFDDANRQHSFDVTIIDDSLFEVDVKDFTLELRFDPFAPEPPPSNIFLSPNTTTVDIIDNEALLGVAIGFLNTSYTVNKDDGLVNIQVGIINEGIMLGISVEVRFFIISQNQSLTEGVLRIDELVFNSTTSIINLPGVAITDYLSEFSESVVANIDFAGEPTSGVTLDPANASINIEVPIIGFDDTEYSVNEADDSVALIVRIRGGGNQCNKTEWALNYTVWSVSAQSSEDYIATDLERIINVSESQPASVMILIMDDNILELNETFQVEIGILNDEDRTCVTLQPNVVNIVIVDDDTAVIGLSVSDNGTASEGMDRPLNLTVAVTSGELGVDVEMELVLLEGTAKNGSDFLISGDQIFTLGPNIGSHTLSIDIINDDIFEAEVENFAIQLSILNATELHGLQLGTQRADLTIQDDDYVTIGFNSTTYTVREINGSVLLQIDLLNGEFDNNVAVSVRLNTIDGSAKSTSDFEKFNETRLPVFSRVGTEQTVNIRVIDDKVFEADEMFMAVLELANDSRIILQPNRTNISIIMDDDTVMVGFTYENYTVTEGVDMLTNITVDLQAEIEQSVVVRVSTQADSAKGGEDFDTITDLQLTFSPGVTSLSVPINITSDGDFEETENFFIILSVRDFALRLNSGTPINLRQNLCQDKKIFSIDSRSDDDEPISIDLSRVFVSQAGNDISFNLAANESERVGVSPARASVTILDNDTVSIGFNMPSYSVNECDGQISIDIVVKGSLKRKIALYLSTSDLTANASVNYGELTNYSLIFDSETESKRTVNISINATDETNLEVDEEFLVSLSFQESEESIPRVTLEPDNATVAIYEIDGQIGFIPDTETDMTVTGPPASIVKVVDEDVGTVNLTVGLVGNICGQIEIEFQVFNFRSFTVIGEDYTIAMERRLILSTESPNTTITIDIINDNQPEPNESFLVSLSFKDQMMIPRVTLDPSSANITIRASDPLPETPPVQSVAIIGGTLGAISVLLISGIILLIIFLLWLNRRTALKKFEGTEDATGLHRAGFSVQSSYKLKLPPHLIVHANNLKMTETIGQGEFGVVYKGHLLEDGGKIVTATVAIKTLKGFYDSATIRDMLKECSKMCEFDHPNVLTLNGVCLDGGPAPFIIMPFMTNGSLLAYLRKNRATLVIESGNRQPEDDNEENVRKQLMDMCLQVARGMEYLAKMKVVHRDLAARNCMIDMSYVIKVADFGLAESVGTKDYFRQDKSAAVKLPLKWLAPESLEDYIFSEKTDVWAFGVTSWEIFTAGKVPYTTVNLNDLPNMLHNGYRLEKPINEACDSEMYMLMQHCWELDSKSRPSFSDLVSSLSQSLEAMAGYMDVGAFGQLQVHESALESAPKEIQEQRQPEKESKEDEVVEVKSKETSM